MKKISLLIGIAFLYGSCQQEQGNDYDLTQYVDPFIGTAYVGHTHPAAQLPFGMVQVGPDTGTKGWEHCAGYYDQDKSIIGFSHTHLSGTGCADMGDIMFMPITNNISFNQGDTLNTENGYRSKFSHNSEIAEPGYYKVTLDDYNIDVELTATTRTAFHQYTYPESDLAGLLIDLGHGLEDTVVASSVKLLNDTVIVGKRRSKGFIRDHTYYFYAVTSAPIIHTVSYADSVIEDKNVAEGTLAKMFFQFRQTNKDDKIKVKVGISTQSIDAAKLNLETENCGWDFDAVRNNAKNTWNKYLHLVEAKTMDDDQKVSLYTALYHSLIMPNLITDADGNYCIPDGTKKQSIGGDYFTNFSLWDTYRAEHPFFELILPDKNADFVRSMVELYKERGVLCTNEYGQNETWCMIGNHATSVIADAYVKGTISDNKEEAAEAIFQSLMTNHPKSDWTTYDKYGYYPYDIITVESVSRTLENCYNDYCAAKMAELINDTEKAAFFAKRAKNYENLFDPTTKMMRGKDSKGEWRTPFTPSALSHSSYQGGDYTEGNAWQYTWHVQQDALNLIKLVGGDDAFANKLDSLFTISLVEQEEGCTLDVTGLIGQYAHGNEPSHHIIYLFTMANHPWRTAELVREVFDKFYLPGRDGLCGNDDCGQMSAWYLFSAMGFYPVSPISGEYVIGAPQVYNMRWNLPGGTLEMEAHHLSKKNKYVESVVLNGEKINSYCITYDQIKNGGKLDFYMTDKQDISFTK